MSCGFLQGVGIASMNGELHHSQRVSVAYDEASKPMKIQMNGEDDAYYANLQEMKLNPHIVQIHSLMIKKTGITIDFIAPLVFDPNDRDLSGSLMRGVKVEGKDKGLFLQPRTSLLFAHKVRGNV